MRMRANAFKNNNENYFLGEYKSLYSISAEYLRESICEVSLHCTYYAGFIEVKLRVAMMELKLHVF